MNKFSNTLKRIAVALILSYLLLAHSGCASRDMTTGQPPTIPITVYPQTKTTTPTQSVKIPTITSTMTQTLSPTITVTVTPTPTNVPTLPVEDRNVRLLELIETNGGCEFPCVWGIQPGTSTFDQTYPSLFELGGWGSLRNRGEETLYTNEFQNFEDGYISRIDVLFRNQTVGIIRGVLIVNDYSQHVDLFDQRYGIRQLLQQFGIPSRVWTILTTTEVYLPSATTYTLWIFYDKDGILLVYNLRAININSDYQVCPRKQNNSSTFLNFSFLTHSSDSSFLLEQDYVKMGGTIPNHISLEEGTGFEIDEFFELITKGGESDCFSTPRDIWP